MFEGGESSLSLEISSEPVVVYGLSARKCKIASAIAIRGHKVSLIDESARMAIMLKPEIIKTYPTVSSLLEDEPLLECSLWMLPSKWRHTFSFLPRFGKLVRT